LTWKSRRKIKRIVSLKKTMTRILRNGNCPKCGGSGYLPEYKHIEGGRCFACDGTGNYENGNHFHNRGNDDYEDDFDNDFDDFSDEGCGEGWSCSNCPNVGCPANACN
jgi:hypothetical protein